jgi:hypothetical protein
MKMLFSAENLVTAAKGALGMSATTGGFYISILPKVEAWLRVSSLFIGCAVGLATFVSIVRKLRQHQNKNKNQNEEKQS